jgi:hypothetical protein
MKDATSQRTYLKTTFLYSFAILLNYTHTHTHTHTLFLVSNFSQPDADNGICDFEKTFYTINQTHVLVLADEREM